MQEGDAGPADVGADHIDRAVGKVDQVCHAEDQRQADRQQRVDIADDQAVDRVIEEACHAPCTYSDLCCSMRVLPSLRQQGTSDFNCGFPFAPAGRKENHN
jgi:hypothetical protein